MWWISRVSLAVCLLVRTVRVSVMVVGNLLVVISDRMVSLRRNGLEGLWLIVVWKQCVVVMKLSLFVVRCVVRQGLVRLGTGWIRALALAGVMGVVLEWIVLLRGRFRVMFRGVEVVFRMGNGMGWGSGVRRVVVALASRNVVRRMASGARNGAAGMGVCGFATVLGGLISDCLLRWGNVSGPAVTWR